MVDGERPISRRAFLGAGFLRGIGERAGAREPRAGAALEAPTKEATPGFAAIRPAACLAFRGLVCRTCEERCPVPGAIRFSAGRPRVDAELCDGCGVCIDVCPAPSPAIHRIAR